MRTIDEGNRNVILMLFENTLSAIAQGGGTLLSYDIVALLPDIGISPDLSLFLQSQFTNDKLGLFRSNVCWAFG